MASGYIFEYHGSVLLYHSRVPGRFSMLSREFLRASESMTSAWPTGMPSTSNCTVASG